jgi:hypothetical protein
MQHLKHIYLTWFVLFFRAGANSWTHGINVWKGVLGVTMLEFALAIAGNFWIRALTGVELLFAIEKWAFEILFVVLFGLNYYALVARAAGVNFEREFASLGKRERTTLSLVGGGIIALIIGLLIFSFYAFGQGH